MDYYVNNIVDFLHSDNALYHFTKLGTGLEHILPNKILKFSKTSGFCDVLEKFFQQPGFVVSKDINQDTLIRSKLLDKAKKRVLMLAFYVFARMIK